MYTWHTLSLTESVSRPYRYMKGSICVLVSTFLGEIHLDLEQLLEKKYLYSQE